MPASLEGYFPEDSGRTHWDYKLPIPQGLVEGNHARKSVIKLCMESLLRTCAVLQQNKPSPCGARVVALIELPRFWSSRVIVFFDDTYYSQFFQRDNEYQSWSRSAAEASLFDVWQLPESLRMKEVFYIERIPDEEGDQNNKLWFFGDVDESLDPTGT